MELGSILKGFNHMFRPDKVDTAVVIGTKVKWLFENLEIFEFVRRT